MKVLHCIFSLEVMVYRKMKILHVTLFIGGCGFLKQGKNRHKNRMTRRSSLETRH